MYCIRALEPAAPAAASMRRSMTTECAQGVKASTQARSISVVRAACLGHITNHSSVWISTNPGRTFNATASAKFPLIRFPSLPSPWQTTPSASSVTMVLLQLLQRRSFHHHDAHHDASLVPQYRRQSHMKFDRSMTHELNQPPPRSAKHQLVPVPIKSQLSHHPRSQRPLKP